MPVADVKILLEGDIKGGEAAATVLWFEGRMFKGEVDRLFGEAIAWEVRREVVRDVRRGDAITS